MENFTTNNPGNNQQNPSPFTINNSNQVQHHPENIIHALPPNSLPLFDHPMAAANSNVGQLIMNPENISPPWLYPPHNLNFFFSNSTNPSQEDIALMNVLGFPAPGLPNQQTSTFNHGNDTNNQQPLFPDISTPALPVSEAGNGNSNLNYNPTSNMPPLVVPENLAFNIGSSGGSNEANGGNGEARTTRSKPKGRPIGSKNKAKLKMNEDLMPTQSAVTLVIPPNCDINSWLLAHALSRKVSLTVIGGFGSISEVVLKFVESQQEPFVYAGEFMTMMSISGTYTYSPGGSSGIFFNVIVSRESGQVIAGTATRIMTAGAVSLTVAYLNYRG